MSIVSGVHGPAYATAASSAPYAASAPYDASAVGSTDGSGGSTGGVDTITKPGTSSLYGLGKDDFLKLFLAQLQNQDPTNPVDDNQFLNQLSQLTMVDTLQQVQQALSGSQLAESSALIGKQVIGLDSNGGQVSGVVDRVVQTSDAGLLLMIGSQSITPSNILSVAPAPVPVTPGSDSSANGTV